MKKFLSFIFSMFFTGILLVVFAVAIGYATFIENDYGTITAKILIYNSKWFEILMIVLTINLIGSIFKYELFTRKKWTVLLFHLSFIVILIGAAITRYYGYEGSMHIREGESTDFIVSEANYVTIKAKSGNETVETEKEVKFSPYTANSFSETIEVGGQSIHIKNEVFMPSAAENLVVDPSGEPIVSLIAVYNGVRADFNLRQGDLKHFGPISVGFEAAKKVNVQLKLVDGSIVLVSSDTIQASQMNESQSELIPADSAVAVNNQKVYTLNGLNFAVKQFLQKGKTQLVYQQAQRGAPTTDAIKTILSSGDESKELVVYGQNGTVGDFYTTHINGTEISISYGAKIIQLPFAIYLEDFQLERYPGSNSPSSYASEVVLKDGSYEMPYRIFMNNILKHKGYRFFQSSYDTDEKGTILSVNSDKAGTSVTYFGYLIMALGMVLTLFNRNSRFKRLLKASAKLAAERKKLMVMLAAGILLSFPAHSQSTAYTDMDKDHVKAFEELLVQSRKGRVEPVSTIASEILRKVAKETSWKGLSATEVFLDMQANPEKWKNIPVIKVANPELRKMLGAQGKYASLNSIVVPREMGGYKLNKMVQEAYAKKSNQRNKLDKEVINVDERVNILMRVFTDGFLNVFPIPGDENHKWISINETHEMESDDAAFAHQTIQAYFNSVASKDWATANQLLTNLKTYQQKYGAKISPSPTKVKLEVLYNQLNIFGKLAKIFMFTGLILLVLQLVTLFNPKIQLRWLKNLALIFIFILFVAETAGLGIRWYISEHAPWSNGYESMIFISWATCLGGLIFAKRSEITLSLTSVLAGLTLLVAGMSWMSPEITNLVPVLQSYWLIIHVAIITASYGFLGISALLGFLNLVLMIFKNKNNAQRINLTIRELVNIIQISLIIGVLMLIIGSFLGGVWANESWGRYWGWDPKETWALVTVIVYTFITHMHRIPGLRGNFAMSTAAVLAISSVLMTYFGVNYYLSGLHSYAQGEPAPIPSGVYVAIIVVAIVVVAAYMAEKVKPTPAEELEE
ncbi:cytochrome C biogenesis protein [Maribellus luteus]|uniref:Cytochrome C biogenesis protein n=1 Tax=Maribellus luteus TaxID=2305463 RepID=A0A399T6B6_9BACT|nr:cytochrome c biogenesis protein CcsA [Maribellus luteus]RIJ50709.1 cytochrome C biogenesis protein [Maribellus luteus]